MSAFVSKDPAVLKIQARMRKEAKRLNTSLLYLGQIIGKNPRTIRRWCKMGLIPGAYRTEGGQWRIDGLTPGKARSIKINARRKGFLLRDRRAKDPFASTHSDLRKQFPKMTQTELAKELWLSEHYLRRQEVEIETWKKFEYTDEQKAAIDKIPAKVLESVKREPFRTEVIIQSRKLHMIRSRIKLTRRTLAHMMRISEITLKRHMTNNGISMAWTKTQLANWIGCSSPPWPSALHSPPSRA